MVDIHMNNLTKAIGISCFRTLDNLRDPLYVVDKDLRILSVNRTFKKWMNGLQIDIQPEGQHLPELDVFLNRFEYLPLRPEYRHSSTLMPSTLSVIIQASRPLKLLANGSFSWITYTESPHPQVLLLR